jgi:hypothetical protein
MTKKIASILVFLGVLAGLAFAQQGQNTLTQTNLTNAIGSSPTTIYLTSVTGINAPQTTGAPVSWIYIDREAMGVMGVNTNLTSVSVRRGDLGTRATSHSAGEIVIISYPYTTQLATGGNPVNNGFDDHDPAQGAACTVGYNGQTTLPAANPTINVLSGAQWLCSTITSQWVPGFNNPLAPSAAAPTKAVASASSITPTGPLFHVTGTTQVTLVNVPVGFNANGTTANVGGGQFCTIPDAAYTTATGGTATATAIPFKKASTAVIGQVLCFTYDPANNLFDASY